MSTALAIAATTKVLTRILDNNVNAAGLSGVLEAPITSALPPDRIQIGDGEKPHLNLFLHQVSFNAGWRDDGLPSRDSQGARVSRPPLAIDLHYILSAYGDVEYQSEILLGLGMQAFHENAVLTRDEIRSVFIPPPPGLTLQEQLLIVMAASKLADQVELIKIVPGSLSTEEISKLWAAFGTKYRTSVAYHASVILIESSGSFRSTLPVLQRNVFAIAFRQPVIDLVEEPTVPFAPGVSIHLQGQNMLAQGSVVRFGTGEEQAPDKLLSTSGRLTVLLPALKAGLNAIQVIRKMPLGPGQPRTLVESNVAAFVLQPVIKSKTLTPGAPPSLSVTVDPPIRAGQKVSLLFDQTSIAPGASPLGFVFDMPSPVGPPVATVAALLPGIVAGTYLLRVSVDGARSPFTFDAAGAFAGPTVTI